MEHEEAKRFLRKYATISIALQYFFVLAFAAFVFLNIFLDLVKNSVLIVFALLVMFLERTVQFWYRAKIESIALNELNPPKMKAVLETKGLYAYLPNRYLTAHYYNGDYQETLDMCNCLLKNKKDKQPWAYYSYIAGVYFQLGDIDGLKTACEKFEAYKTVNQRIDIFCPLMKLYKLYANEEYEELKKLYNSEEKAQYNRATYMVCEYIHAVNYYTLGETEKAKAIFKHISKDAPLLNVGKLSAKQIENIEQGKEYETNQVKIIPNESYELHPRTKKANVYHIIRLCCFALIIFMLAIIAILELKQEQIRKEQEEELEQFEKKLYGVIDEAYDNFEVLAGFDVEKNDKTVEYMVVFENENNELIVGYYVWYPDEQKNGFIPDSENVVIGKAYYSDSPCSDYTICYTIYESEGDLPNDYYTMRGFNCNDQKLYICITDIY